MSSYGFVKKCDGFAKLIVIAKAVCRGIRYDQVALLNALDTPVLIGSATSVATS